MVLKLGRFCGSYSQHFNMSWYTSSGHWSGAFRRVPGKRGNQVIEGTSNKKQSTFSQLNIFLRIKINQPTNQIGQTNQLITNLIMAVKFMWLISALTNF